MLCRILKKAIKQWPDIEFVGSRDLINLIN
jgi:hypothetical protein